MSTSATSLIGGSVATFAHAVIYNNGPKQVRVKKERINFILTQWSCGFAPPVLEGARKRKCDIQSVLFVTHLMRPLLASRPMAAKTPCVTVSWQLPMEEMPSWESL